MEKDCAGKVGYTVITIVQTRKCEFLRENGIKRIHIRPARGNKGFCQAGYSGNWKEYGQYW